MAEAVEQHRHNLRDCHNSSNDCQIQTQGLTGNQVIIERGDDQDDANYHRYARGIVPMKTFIFFYFMKREPEKIQNIVPSHVEYWNRKKLDQYKGGPFSDRTGGLITFASENLDQANDIINHDPFIINDVIDKKWIKEWMPVE